MSRSEKNYHNKGEEDYANDRGYNPPWGSLVHDLLGRSDSMIEEDKAYEKGWKNAKEQDD